MATKLVAVPTSPKIEKGVPIPVRGKTVGLTNTLRSMEVGDSVFVPGISAGDVGGRFAWLKPLKFTVRKQVGGVRIWRIA